MVCCVCVPAEARRGGLHKETQVAEAASPRPHPPLTPSPGPHPIPKADCCYTPYHIYQAFTHLTYTPRILCASLRVLYVNNLIPLPTLAQRYYV